MVDFKALSEKLYRESTPEQRARIDAYHEREARLDTTRRGIMATFTRYEMVPVIDLSVPPWKAKATRHEMKAVKSWTKPIEMRIEDRTDFQDREYEIIQFMGGSTGSEAFEISREHVDGLSEWTTGDDPDLLSICGGSARFNGCSVSRTEVLAYILEMRPSLRGDAGMSASSPAI